MASPTIEQVTASITLPVYNKDGQEVGTVTVDPAAFGGKISTRLMHEAVLMYETNKRQGTHSTLRRGEVAGSTKKLFRQKGTGNARAGTKRTNKRRGGGTAKGPKPRDYSYRLPKKALRSATRMAVLSKLRDKETIIVDDFGITEIKTKAVASLLKALKLEGQSVLIGTPARDEKVYKSARNLPKVTILPTSDFNTYDVLRPKTLLLSKAALDALTTAKKD
ncbi:MAG: 50S ribosomal protein L4 [Gemmataceae bacterium]|jgi:large subunit ribosomal protein L4|nr:50S ribosomal protein L4 [Gemmataceae bacterium]